MKILEVRRSCLVLFTLLILLGSGALYSSLTTAAEKRGKVIDFEDELVEGVNKQPLDSLSSISERGKDGRKTHLYRKRQGFRVETLETLREVRVWQ